MSPLSNLSNKHIADDIAPVISFSICLSYNADVSCISLTHYKPLLQNMSKRSLLRVIFVLLLFGTIVASYTSDTTLSIVVEIKLVDVSVIFAISILVAPINFVQMEDYVITFI